MIGRDTKKGFYKNLGMQLRAFIAASKDTQDPIEFALNMLAYQTGISALALYVAATTGKMDVSEILRIMPENTRVAFEALIEDALKKLVSLEDIAFILKKEGGNA